MYSFLLVAYLAVFAFFGEDEPSNASNSLDPLPEIVCFGKIVLALLRRVIEIIFKKMIKLYLLDLKPGVRQQLSNKVGIPCSRDKGQLKFLLNVIQFQHLISMECRTPWIALTMLQRTRKTFAEV